LDAGSEPRELRHELKLACDEASLPQVRMALRLDPAGIRTLHPERLVQSLYLDTSHQRALEENLAGLSEREKIRLRWYGPETRGVSAQLERKCRRNSLGWKDVLPFPEAFDVAGCERRAFVDELTRRADARWRVLLAGLEPVQWVRYRREYHTSADRRVRITLDRELTFFDQRPLGRLSDAQRTPRPRILVIELKCAPEDIERAQAIVSKLSIPIGRCSKFVLAAAPDSGPMVSRFEV
jgi:hypothetical protein